MSVLLGPNPRKNCSSKEVRTIRPMCKNKRKWMHENITLVLCICTLKCSMPMRSKYLQEQNKQHRNKHHHHHHQQQQNAAMHHTPKQRYRHAADKNELDLHGEPFGWHWPHDHAVRAAHAPLVCMFVCMFVCVCMHVCMYVQCM